MKTAVTRFFRSVAGKVFAAFTVCLLLLLLLHLLLTTFALADIQRQERHALLNAAYADVCVVTAKRLDPVPVLERYHDDYDMSIVIRTQYRVFYSTDRSSALIGTPPSLRDGTFTISDHTDSDGYETVLHGKTNEGLFVTLRLPSDQTPLAAAFADNVGWYIALGALLLGCVVAFILSRLITRPIRRLSGLAQKMAKLDFSERYTGESQDELGDLGRSLNTVSETMESTLSELKTANARLKNDVETTANQNEARNRFIRNVSHELKTPISLIQTYAEGLHENIAADAASREYYCSVIEDEAQKLSQILAKLTTLMQLESGGDELTIEHVDLSALLSKLLQRHAPLFAERAITLPTLPDGPLLVWGDALLIEQVFTNYLTNALHHVTDGGEIRITCTPIENAVRVTVFNTGDQIPADDLPHLFESFYKVDKARTRAYGGTGIGLSVVAAIMQAHSMPYGVQNRDDGVEFFAEFSV